MGQWHFFDPGGGEPWRKWTEEGRERIDIIVDSGASTSMLPRSVAPGHPLKPGASPKVYKTASKDEVRKDGEKELVCGFMNGKDMTTTWEVGDIHRPLSSVSRMVRNGNCVWFDTDANGGSGIYNYKTGQSMKIFQKDGIYVLPAWIKPTGNPSGFGRQAKP